MEKIILFYKFVPVKDPQALKLWQQTLAESLSLRGRLIVAKHGLNGTVGGDLSALKVYIKKTRAYPGFKDLAIKWSNGSAQDFPRLSVKVRPELVSFKVSKMVKPRAGGVGGSGQKLKPSQLHQLIKKRGDQVVMFDGRSRREAAIGRFKNAVVPAVDHARDFKREINKPKYQALKDKAVVTYCTGGIRCEVLSLLMKESGFKEVYQLDGGIMKYGEQYQDRGLWQGAMYVFDKRLSTKFSNESKDIGKCCFCSKTTSDYDNCSLKKCNKLILICSSCRTESTHCPAHQKVSLMAG